MNPERTERNSAMVDQLVRLGPWHLDVQITPELSTRAAVEADDNSREVSFISARNNFHGLLRRIYPEGLAGRTVLDCACNCGGYSFWAKEFGASECFGFDVRQHWIDQARFLAENRTLPSDGIRFEVCDLYDLPKLELEPFDVTIFKGIFYHLPDPITGLKIAADLTKELLILETATKDGLPDGMLAVDKESPTALMSGVYGLMWLPTGPEVLTRILKWMGFPHTKVVFRLAGDERTPPSTRGRIQMVASRQQNLLEDFE